MDCCPFALDLSDAPAMTTSNPVSACLKVLDGSPVTAKGRPWPVQFLPDF
jgi:hypothetical protein